MEGTLEETAVKEPNQHVDLRDELIPNGVNGRYDDSDEHSENIKEGAESRLGLEDFGDSKESDTEKMESEECAEYAQHHDLLDDVDSEAMEIDGSKTDKDIESMEVDQRSNSSEVECLDEVNSEDGFRDENSQNNMRQSNLKQHDGNLNASVEELSDNVVCLENSSPMKMVEENGSMGSPEIEEIEEITDSAQRSESPSCDREPTTPKKKQRKVIDLSNVTPRRSSRNIKRTSYIEKEDEDEDGQRRLMKVDHDDDDDDESDIEEIKPEDPLAVDRENSRNRSPKNNKTTIVVNDTKRLVEIAAGTKMSNMKGGKKEPTLVIIDTNSILSGRGGVPVSSSTKSSSHSSLGSSTFSVVPVGTTTMYPNMRTTITPVPMKSTSTSSPKSTSITPVPPVQQQSALPILPTLTDDMFVVEAPSFIVPYVYEKPPIKPLREFVTKLETCIKEKEKEDREKEKEEGDDDDDEDMKDEIETKAPSETEKREERKGGGTYFDLPLGKFFIQIGVNLVQEFVQTDLLRTQKRKQGKGQPSAETQHAINSLIKNLEFSKENNEPFHLELKKCEFCNFKTESSLAMQHHLETPHMRNYVYKCNFCPLEVRSPHDILFHMEAEHNTRGRLERGPAFHQCPNCPFEDNQKGKLTRHIIACTKKFRPERNLEPAADWEPPAKIPSISNWSQYYNYPTMNRLNRPRPIGPTNSGGLTMTMGVKGPQPLLPKLLPAPVPGRGRGRPPMQPRFSDMKTMRPDNVASMMYRPSSSGLLVPTSYQFGANQMFQMVGASGTVVSTTTSANSSASNPKNPTAKLLSQPSISITPLPRTTTQAPIPGSGSSSKPGGKNTFVICEICDGYIKDLEQLRNHMQWIHKVKIHPKMIYNRPPLNCQKCQFRFFTDQGLERHLLGSHGLVTSSMQEAANKGKDAGRCPACGRVYQWKLLNHVARDHGMTLKPAHLSYKCTVCTATFGMYKQFENHVYSAHSVVAKRVMDKKSSNAPSSPSSRSNDSLLKPLKINDEITIIPQPAAKTSSRTGNSATRPSK